MTVAVLALERHPQRPPAPHVLHVQVAGRWVEVTSVARFGQVVRRFGLRPRSAALLSVDGRVIRKQAYTRPLLLDGVAASASTRLHDGDRITVPIAPDRREPLDRIVVPVIEGLPADPQFTLSRTPGTVVVVRGALTHEIAAARFHAGGAATAPAVPAVALTFDDGPSPQYTPQVLAVLRRFHVPATFFAVGYLAAAYPDLIRAEANAGMEIGNHTYNHPQVPPFDQLPPRLQDDEIALAAADLRRAGVDATTFRPPEGSFSAGVAAAANRLNERVVLWSVDPTDWKPGTTAAAIVRNVLSAVQPGSIVVLHDGGGDRSATVAALPGIITAIRRRGLALVTVDGL